MTIANYEETSGEGLYRRKDPSFYRLSPAKGARVGGTISVGMTSDEQTVEYRPGGYPRKISCPSMWIDYTPDLADENNRTVGGRSTLAVNGREYGEGFGNSLSGRVEFFPRAKDDHRDEYYQRVTIGGTEYYIRASFNMFDSVSDAGRKVLGATVEAIALEYVTDARWHAYRVERAEYQIERKQEKVTEALEELAEAKQALEELG